MRFKKSLKKKIGAGKNIKPPSYNNVMQENRVDILEKRIERIEDSINSFFNKIERIEVRLLGLEGQSSAQLHPFLD